MALDPVTAILDIGGKIFDKFVPDPAQRDAAKLAMFQAQQAGELQQMANDAMLMKAQIDVNAIEAANPNVFVSGWRPATGWVCVIGLAYQWLVVPLATFAYTLYTGHDLPVKPPEMDGNLMALIGSILGVNIITRGIERVKGKA